MSAIEIPKPDPRILARRAEILAGLAALVPPTSLITEEDERRAYETDALTAYRRVPLAVVLPETTEQVSRVLTFLNREGVKVVARGAGTSLAGGAIPSEDAVVLGVSKMSRILDVDIANRTIRVEAGVTNLGVSGACVAAIIASGIIPVAIEYMDRPAIKVCEAFAHAGYPLDVEALLIIEVEGSEAEIEDLIGRITTIAADYNPSGLRISQSEAESAAIWKGRKSAFGAMGRLADYICMDGTIPTGQLSAVLTGIARICEGYGLRVSNIFHAGDGNLHPLVLFNANDPAEQEKAERCGEDILKLCVELGGCLTGEHGVGIEKRDLMTYQFNTIDLDQQMRVKTALDPQWLLNPHKVFPLAGRPV
ncbi:MAG: FAD-binding protein [Rhizobiales bacterium]|nr:FAD-binding protein [Hyphomicrobiales bacterium]